MSTDLIKKNVDETIRTRQDPVKNLTSPNRPWSWPEVNLQRASLMGILNVTPDSFYDGGIYHHTQQHTLISRATEHGIQLLKEGALYLDIGGESSRPGANPVSLQEELDRVLPVIENLLLEEPDAIISIDTVKAEVADLALASGAKIVNDISGLRNKNMRQTVAKHAAGVVIMHMKGTPKTMQSGDLSSENITLETYEWLAQQHQYAIEDGIHPDSIALDIGIGFGKTVTQNLQLLKELSLFKTLTSSLLVGVSRKSFIGAISGEDVAYRLPGSLSALIEGTQRGGNIFRVHDVAESRQALMIANSIRLGEPAKPPLSLSEYLQYLGG